MDKKLDFLTKELVDQAIQVINTNGIPVKREGTTYGLLVSQKHYPFKLVVTEAARILGINLSAEDFRSSNENRMGFQELTGYQIVIKKVEVNYVNFKKLLEYFIAHLEWLVTSDVKNRGFSKYIGPLIENNVFKRTGQGYSGALIQHQIRNWDTYENGNICINIQPNFGSYKSSKSYLNWLDTGLNIVAIWKGDKILSLCQEEYLYWEDTPRRLPLGDKVTVDTLELFNPEDSISNALIKFYEDYNKAIKGYIALEKIKRMKLSLKTYIDLLHYKKQIILQGPPGTGKTREAKLIALEMLSLADTEDLKHTDQFKIIQFHPSYTYEDLVRGIVAQPNQDGDGILYEADNKILGEFAARALKNYNESRASISQRPKVSSFDAFVTEVLIKIDENEKYMISEKVYIYFADNARFKYKGDNWTAHPNGLNMNFVELKKIINLGLDTRQEIHRNESLNSLTRQHATYYQNVIELYKIFVASRHINEVADVEEKKYVLIIDEINRANLPSVLGELIYALEYRGEAVDSMYAIGNDNELILPPNLYIIGTMNTADRSVGHIDYAIRRRFAFVDVLPKNLKVTQGLEGFDDDLFLEVERLFDNSLSPEFEKKDVQLGHSYFIDKSDKGASMQIRLDYEIKPMLLEYVRDGVLVGDEVKVKIQNLRTFI